MLLGQAGERGDPGVDGLELALQGRDLRLDGLPSPNCSRASCSASAWASSMPLMITPMNRLRMIIVPVRTKDTKKAAESRGWATGETHCTTESGL